MSDSHVRRDVRMDKRECIKGSKYTAEILNLGGGQNHKESNGDLTPLFLVPKLAF